MTDTVRAPAHIAKIVEALGQDRAIQFLLEFGGGQLTISSPPGGPTQVAATIPLLLNRGEPGVQL